MNDRVTVTVIELQGERSLRSLAHLCAFSLRTRCVKSCRAIPESSSKHARRTRATHYDDTHNWPPMRQWPAGVGRTSIPSLWIAQTPSAPLQHKSTPQERAAPCLRELQLRLHLIDAKIAPISPRKAATSCSSSCSCVEGRLHKNGAAITAQQATTQRARQVHGRSPTDSACSSCQTSFHIN